MIGSPEICGGPFFVVTISVNERSLWQQ